MKKIHFRTNLIMVLFAVMMLTGCTSVINLTTEEEDLIAEYAAGSVVRAYWEDKNQFNVSANKTQVETEPETEKPTSGQTEKPTNSSTAPSDSQVETTTPGTAGTVEGSVATLEESLGITGVEVTMLGYDVYEKYPQDLYTFTVDATSGKKLLVVEYDVWNSVDAPATMTVNTEGVSVKAIINGSKSVNVYKTMLSNDIMNMNDTDFEPGQAETGVLIFMIDEELAAEIETVDVEVTKK